MDRDYALYLLEKIKKDYNKLALHFSLTRRFPWFEFLFLIKYIKSGDKILDLGCGNGRFIELIKDLPIEYTGLDISQELIFLSKKRFENLKKTGQLKIKNFHLVIGDALNLPFEDNSFDAIFSISVFHQIPSLEFRLRFLKEARRVLKNEGFLILSVWNFWQKKFLLNLIKYTLLKLLRKVKLDFKDIFIPWKTSQNQIILRYYHAFTKSEIKRLCQKSGFKVEKIGFLRSKGRRNIYVVAKKYN